MQLYGEKLKESILSLCWYRKEVLYIINVIFQIPAISWVPLRTMTLWLINSVNYEWVPRSTVNHLKHGRFDVVGNFTLKCIAMRKCFYSENHTNKLPPINWSCCDRGGREGVRLYTPADNLQIIFMPTWGLASPCAPWQAVWVPRYKRKIPKTCLLFFSVAVHQHRRC